MTTYTHVIECSDDGEIWQPVISGTDAAEESIVSIAQMILANWLQDKRADGESTEGWRVCVWRGSEQAARPDYILESDRS